MKEESVIKKLKEERKYIIFIFHQDECDKLFNIYKNDKEEDDFLDIYDWMINNLPFSYKPDTKEFNFLNCYASDSGFFPEAEDIERKRIILTVRDIIEMGD